MTADEVRARFAHHTTTVRVSEGARGDHSLGGGEPPKVLTPAAVLVGIADRPEGLTVLLTLRTAHLTDHAGQIAFPGGRMEPEDADEAAGALREAEEEIGLPPSHVELVGQLDTYITGTGYTITPVVGIVRVPYPVKIDAFEVAELFEVPLAFILDPANHHRRTRELHGQQRGYFAIPYLERNIWGATAAMLVNLAEVLNA